MLIELLALMVFLAMAFAFVMKEEGDRTNPWKERHDRVLAELDQSREEVRELRREARAMRANLELLEEANRMLRRSLEGPLQSDDRRVSISSEELRRLNARVANVEDLLDAQVRDNTTLRDRLEGRGGTDLPRCQVSPGFLLRITVSGGDTFHVAPAWPASAAEPAARVPGLTNLGAGKSLNRQQFRAFAAAVQRWGGEQTPACGFTAEVFDTHSNKQLYKSQQRLIDTFFYTAYR